MALAVSEFQLLLTQLAADLGVKIERLLSRIGLLSQEEALAFITQAYPELVRAYLSASGELTVQFYDEQPATTNFTPHLVDLIPDDRLSASGRWALLQGDPVQALMGSSQRAVMDQSRQTVLENLADEYEVPLNEVLEPGTRWARHASANACAFCRMLATRGAVYRTERDAVRVSGRSVDLTTSDRRQRAAKLATTDELLARRMGQTTYVRGSRKGQQKARTLRGQQALGDKYHDHCHCTAVPVRPGGSYEPPDYVDQWNDDYRDAVKAAKAAGNTKGEYGAIDFKAVLREMDKAQR